MRIIVQYILKLLAKAILKRYRPDVIGITGSVGKTSAKEAIAEVLQAEFKVRMSQKNYNTEIGAPLVIIGADNPYRSVLGWMVVFLKAVCKIIKKDKNYPEVLVLEMAADKPGDIKYLVDLIHPKVGVITSVGPTHLEFFGDLEGVLQEKSNMVNWLGSGGIAILNSDDKLISGLKDKIEARLVSYGLGDDAQVRASGVIVDKDLGGISFKLEYKGSQVPVHISNVLGKPVVYSSLAAAAMGIAYGMNLIEIGKRLAGLKPLAGRLNLIAGIKGTRIIDDSYNSSPLAVKAALEVLFHLNCTGEKWAVLGDMLELGKESEADHKEMGEMVAKLGIDYLVTAGERSTDISLAANEYGMNPDRVFNFDNSAEAGKFLQDRIQEGDLILIKGSEGIRMEKAVKEIMAEPGRAEEILVRQMGMWKNK